MSAPRPAQAGRPPRGSRKVAQPHFLETLLGAGPPSRTVAWLGGRPLSAAALLAAAMQLAERLPAQGDAINLCQDRFLFSAGLLATQLRQRNCLLPPNALPATLALLQGSDQPSPFALSDDAALLPPLREQGLHTVFLEHVAAGHAAAASAGIATDFAPAPDRPAFSLLTSGSTAVPTAHPKSWATARLITQAGVQSLAEHLGWRDLAGLNIVATVPSQHSYGIESAVLLALLGGAAFDCARPFYPADVAAALARLPRPRALVTTPFHLKAVVQAGLALPQVDLILSATAPLSPQLAQQAESALGAPLIEIYGCTEAGQVATRRTTRTDLWRTMGALRLHADPAAPADRAVVSGGHVRLPTPLADLLELQDERHFRLLGRANDLIHVAGKRSSLGHLNYHLNRIQGVLDGAFWQPDEAPDSVARLVAFVVAPGVSAQHILGALRPVLDAAFLPRRVVPVAALPREATGKLTSAALREFALRTLAPAAGSP